MKIISLSMLFFLVLGTSCGQDSHGKKSQSEDNIYYKVDAENPGTCFEIKANPGEVLVDSRKASKGRCPATMEVDGKSTGQYVSCPFRLSDHDTTMIFYQRIVSEGQVLDLTMLDKAAICEIYTKAIAESDVANSLF